jgi:hypothetical protein
MVSSLSIRSNIRLETNCWIAATPQIGQKRRRSEDEREDTPLSKKPKGVEDTVPEDGENDASSSRGASPAEVATPGNEEVEVKEVTKGVKGVELEGKDKAVGGEELPAKERDATPPLDEKETKKKQVAPGSPMKDIEKSKAADAPVVPTPSSNAPAPIPSRPRAKKSNTAPSKKPQQAPASPPRKKKPLPNRKNAASKAAVVPSDTKEKSDVLVSAAANTATGKEGVAV